MTRGCQENPGSLKNWSHPPDPNRRPTDYEYSLSRKALPAVGSGFSAPLLDGTGSRDFEEHLGQSEVRGVSEDHEAAVIAGVVGKGYYTQTLRDKVTPAVTRPFLRHQKADWTAR